MKAIISPPAPAVLPAGDQRAVRIDGPTPIYVRPIPGGVQLELDGLRKQIVEDVLTLLLDPADTGLWDRLHEVAELTPETPLPQGRMPYEELVADLTDRASYRVTLYGRARLLQMSHLLRAYALRAPGQHHTDRGAA